MAGQAFRGAWRPSFLFKAAYRHLRAGDQEAFERFDTRHQLAALAAQEPLADPMFLRHIGEEPSLRQQAQTLAAFRRIGLRMTGPDSRYPHTPRLPK